ncbi:hypothetical protein PS639_06065 [Pseudomonas fluorescens]|nr:hypothetical protein PS639_06065 [Pseudomonas fluorescens]
MGAAWLKAAFAGKPGSYRGGADVCSLEGLVGGLKII